MAARINNSNFNQRRPKGGLLPTPVFNHSEGCFYPPFTGTSNSYTVVPLKIETKMGAKRVCPRCVHGLIVLATQLHGLPAPKDTLVCELPSDNLIPTLYPDEDQAANFNLVLEKYGLNSQCLTHFSRECPLKSTNASVQIFSLTYRIPLSQLTSYKRDVLKQMRKNKTCIRCGREYFGSRLPLLSEHGQCSFWDSENSSLVSSSRFASTITANIIPSD